MLSAFDRAVESADDLLEGSRPARRDGLSLASEPELVGSIHRGRRQTLAQPLSETQALGMPNGAEKQGGD